jgi:hypothetical protein
MNITKAQMLERIREWKGAFDTHPDKMDEWSLCFMEDYEVYDAIRSLIESSGEKVVPASDRLTVLCANAPTIKPDVTAEEAIRRLKLTIDRAYKWRTAQLGYKTAENEKPCDEAALAVIRAALTATIKPPLTVAPTIQVTREWLTGAIGTIAFRAFTCENHRALVDCIEQDMARLEEMLRELGIEVEP